MPKYTRFSDNQIEESLEISPGLIVDFDADGEIVGYETLAEDPETIRAREKEAEEIVLRAKEIAQVSTRSLEESRAAFREAWKAISDSWKIMVANAKRVDSKNR